MNSKGQIGVGVMILSFIGVIVALSLLTGGISNSVGQLTNTAEVVNKSFTLAAQNAFVYDVNCVNFKGTPVVINDTGTQDVVPAAQYSFTARINPSTGLKTLAIKTVTAGMAAAPVNASYTCLPQGYAEDSASRSIVDLVILFAALAVIAFVLYFVGKNLKELY